VYKEIPRVMKTSVLNTALVALFSIGNLFAQDVTTVTANNTDISDNLDLQAVASIFGESADLEDFERRLNNPNNQISNLDLNGDNRVDYLRVIEATENNTHLIILQAVLAVDTYQDVATIEVERDSNNNVSVQVVGDVYMYGPNYIYEPVYAVRPVIFGVFWVNTYRPYYSPWYWGYYPTYYTYWSPWPVYRYRNHIHNCINVHNTYVYVNTRRSTRAVNLYEGRRQNAYERQYPGRSFTSRNANVTNRHQLEQNRQVATTRGTTTRGNTGNGRNVTTATNNGRSNGTSTINRGRTVTTNEPTRINTRGNNSGNGNSTTVRSNGNNTTVRSTTPARTTTPSVRNNTPARSTGTSPSRNSTTPSVRSNTPVRSSNTPAVRTTTPQRQQTTTPSVRSSQPQRQSTPSVRSTPNASPRQSTPTSDRSSGNSRGNSGKGRN
jgi:hypothetical protein